ncbi:MAG TPA: gliding motility-associated C-terminal domain-containing protein [Catalimonadaceae bacterium]|nr:gliding motility-associated C-terminal domain-containing protein [Catalimonadaceae bacterium]
MYRLFINVNDVKPRITVRQVNSKLDQGRGDVDPSTLKLIYNGVADQLACMLHANGRDSWLIARIQNTDSLMAFLVTRDGVVDTVYTDIDSPARKPSYLPPFTTNGRDCQLKTSPNSRMLFVPRRSLEYPFHELYQFDRSSGVFLNKVLIRDTTISSGLYPNSFPDGCFSPDSRLLYLSSGFRRAVAIDTDGPGFFWQYDLSVFDSAAIEQSKMYLGKIDRFISTKPEPFPFSPRFQLAIDGKIYISPGSNKDSLMSVIHCPDKRGISCQLKLRDYNLRPGPHPFKAGLNGSFFPTLNQTFVRNAGIFQLQANKRSICQSDTLELSGYGAGAERFQWTVSPAFPASVKLDTLTWQKIPTRQLAPGNYTFSCRAFSRCGDVFEKTISVEIKPLPARPMVSTIQKTVPCKGDSVILKVLNPVVGNQYFWSTGDTASFTIVRQTGLYSLDSVSNSVGCGMKVGDTLVVSVKNVLVPVSPVLESPQLVEVCTGVQSSTLKVQSTGSSVVWNTGQTGDSVSVSGAGKYWAIHQTEEGCTSGASDTVTIVVEPLPVVQLVASDNGHCLGNEETKEYKVISTNSKVNTVEVEGGEVVEETDSTLTVHWFDGTQTQADSRLTIKSLNRLGCAGTDLVFSPVPNPESCRELYPLFIPNLVTANNDNLNDSWEMGNILYHQPVSVRIYNRWGQIVFETDSYQNNWPNTSLLSGTYFFRVSSFGKEWKGWMEVK